MTADQPAETHDVAAIPVLSSASDAVAAARAYAESIADAPGVTIDEDWDVMGQRATVSGTATFEHVPVEPGLVIRQRPVRAGRGERGRRAL